MFRIEISAQRLPLLKLSVIFLSSLGKFRNITSHSVTTAFSLAYFLYFEKYNEIHEITFLSVLASVCVCVKVKKGKVVPVLN
jgi:hypothetical protein